MLTRRRLFEFVGIFTGSVIGSIFLSNCRHTERGTNSEILRRGGYPYPYPNPYQYNPYPYSYQYGPYPYSYQYGPYPYSYQYGPYQGKTCSGSYFDHETGAYLRIYYGGSNCYSSGRTFFDNPFYAKKNKLRTELGMNKEFFERLTSYLG